MFSPNRSGNAHKHSWQESFAVYSRPKVIGMLFLGFSAGLPFLLVFSTLSAWLTDANVSRTTIGFFSWVGIMYSVKVFWAPVVDRVPLPILGKLLGQRRSWLLLAQSGIATGLLLLAYTTPENNLQLFALLALFVAFSSATQDVVIDAYRIESIENEYQAAMAATYVLGYRFATLAAGAGALYIAEYINWQVAYLSMAALTGVGVITTFVIREHARQLDNDTLAGEKELINQIEGVSHVNGLAQKITQWFVSAVISPFVDFFQSKGKYALLILLLISTYRITDITMAVMANPFYLDLGFTKTNIADVTKIFGFFLTITGAVLGGVMVMRYGIMRMMLVGGVLVIFTNLLFALLSTMGANIIMLAVVIGADSLAGGIAISVFIAYLSSLTNKAYTATQYALFSSLMTLFPKIIAGFSGVVVDAYGYFAFYIYTSCLGLPALFVVLYLLKNQQQNNLT